VRDMLVRLLVLLVARSRLRRISASFVRQDF
jgi:hypothetical protein